MAPDAARNRAERSVLDRFTTASRVCLIVTALIAAITLLAWRTPAVAALLPAGWWLMQAATALCVLLLATALHLSAADGAGPARLFGLLCAGAALLIAAAALLEHATGARLPFGSVLVAAIARGRLRPTSMQSAVCVMVLGASIAIPPARRGVLGHLADVLIAILSALILVLVGGHAFKATLLVGTTADVLISPQTLLCVALLTFVRAVQRAPFGIPSVLVSGGTGGGLARVLLPASAALSYLVVGGEQVLDASGLLARPYAAAVTASAMAAILIATLLVLARRIDSLERELRDLSLKDELTGVANRRGFDLLSRQSIRDAAREGAAMTLLFLDVDGLKGVNDTLGHDAGSRLLQEVADLLLRTLRASDVLGRVGGDEFAVVARGRLAEIEPVLRRLDDAIRAANTADRPYRISVSVGRVEFDSAGPESLSEVMARGDAEMYRNKRERRLARDVVTG
jgi:diguanylate cyclase (GGDEF)-like protein